MKSASFVLLATLLVATPAHAQFGGALGKIQKAKDIKDKADDMNFSDKEERDLGEQVSLSLRQKFGVYQNAEVGKYVSLVGNVLAQQSTKPELAWTFIVLDTDGVNAFAAPGGIVHITRGLLGLMKNEAELAGVLGHEITHITAKHTVRAIQQSKGAGIVADGAGAGGTRAGFISKLSEKLFQKILDGEFSQSDENESDKVGVQLANKVGYAPNGLAEALKKVQARNANAADRNGMFASHPAIKERIEKIESQIKSEKLGASATAQARYAKNITFDAKPITEIAVATDGAAGLAGDSKSAGKKDDEKKEEPKKKGGMLGKFTTSSSDQKASSQTVASAGARGIKPDRDAKGGPNKNPLGIKVTPADLEAFRKGIVA